MVKGKKFVNLIDIGDPVELASRYSDEGADEIVLLDISASLEGRGPFLDIVRRVAETITIPLTVGGGIRSLEDILRLLRAGADKVSLNTILTQQPSLLAEASRRVGSQALVGSVDALRADGFWRVHVKSGTADTGRDAVAWAHHLVGLGIGELLVTSIENDGMKQGYDLELLKRLTSTVSVPVIASGGAGSREDIRDALLIGGADAVLAASVFHFNEHPIPGLKHYLQSQHLPIRL